MTPLRRYLALFLALVLTLTGHQAAVARGAQQVAGEAVICLGQTVVTVLVDADGQPVEKTHLCPDLAVTLFASAAGSAVPATPEPVWVPMERVDAAIRVEARSAVTPQARGPPRSV